MERIRKDHEAPLATSEWGWKYHHIGIPTDKIPDDERYLPSLKFGVAGFDTSPFGIEWMRFEKDCTLDEIIRTVPHVAFEVENIDEELRKHDFKIISQSSSPSNGVKVVMIEHNGAPVELIEFGKSLLPPPADYDEEEAAGP